MMRIAVTGCGAVSPLGVGTEATWDSLRTGVNGIRELDDAVVGNAPVRIAGTVGTGFVDALPVPEQRRLDRTEQFALCAGREAWAQGGRPSVDPDRLATAIGTAGGGLGTILAQDDIRRTSGPRRVSPHAITMLMANGAAGWLSIELGARAGAYTLTSACSSGSEAIAYGVNLIRSGVADVVVAGGTEAVVSPLILTAFAQVRALSTNPDPASASRPFDTDRDGFVLSEGAAVLLLEREDHALARGAKIFGYVDGTATTSDARDIVNGNPENQARTITAALHDADATPEEVGLVHAHATSTPAGDRNESDALIAARIAAPVTATKSMTGHTLGASGAFGALASLMAMHHHTIPPTTNIRTIDPAIPHDIVTSPRPTNAQTALVNSFGFGGHNVALILRAR